MEAVRKYPHKAGNGMKRLRMFRPATYCVAFLALATGLLSVGCTPQLAGQNPNDLAQAKSRTLVAGDTDVTLPTTVIQTFEVNVAAGQDIEVIALPKQTAVLGVGLVVSPDGREFVSHPGAEKRSLDGRFRVERRPLDDGGAGLRFTGTASSAGLWRFSLLVQPKYTQDDLRHALGHRTFLQTLILWMYMLNDQPVLDDPAAVVFFSAFPEAVYPQSPLDVLLRVSTGDAGDFIDPSDINDGGDGGGTDGGDGDSGDSDGGNGGGDSGGDGGDGGDDGGGDGGGTDNKTPPQSITLDAIVKTGDAVPEQSGATFTYFGNPIIDDDGRVAFFAAYDGGAGTAGLYVWESDALKRVIDNDPAWKGAIPGLGADDEFTGPNVRWDAGSPHLAWGPGGRLLFGAHLNGFAQVNALFRWRASDEDLLLVGSAELTRTAIPDSTEDFIPDFYHPALSDDGTAMFSNRYSYFRENGSFVLFKRGVFTTDGSTTTEIAVESVPGQPDFAEFIDKPVLLTTHNAAGDFLFQAAYMSIEGNRGVYLLRDGSLSRVVDNAPDRSFTGLPAASQVGALGQDFDALAIGANGHIAIDTTLTVAGVTRNTILRWSGSVWSEFYAPAGAEATDLLSGITDQGQALYLADGEPRFGDNLSAVNFAQLLPVELASVDLTWPAFGGAVSNQERALVYYQRTGADGDAGILLWSGEKMFTVIDSTAPVGLDTIDVIFVGADRGATEADRVGTLSHRPEINRPGVSGAINDQDQWTFRAGSLGPDGDENTADDEQAIFLGRGE